MANLGFKLLKLFAADALNNGQFGSAQLGTKVLSDDPDVLQALPAWENGWLAAVISGQRLPTLEEMQAVQFVLSYGVTGQQQWGIWPWSAEQTYGTGSITNAGGVLYKSLQDDNINHAPDSSPLWWEEVSAGSVQNNWTATTDPTVNDDEGEGYAQGSIWYNTVSGEIFICVDATDGVAVWVSTAPQIITDYIGVLIETPENGDYTVTLNAPYAMTITETTTQSSSGTCTMTFKINSTPLGGTANAVSTSEQSQAHSSANSVDAGDNIVITVSSNSNCVRAAVTIKFTRAL